MAALDKRRLRNKAVLIYKILNDHSATNQQLFYKKNDPVQSFSVFLL